MTITPMHATLAAGVFAASLALTGAAYAQADQDQSENNAQKDSVRERIQAQNDWSTADPDSEDNQANQPDKAPGQATEDEPTTGLDSPANAAGDGDDASLDVQQASPARTLQLAADPLTAGANTPWISISGNVRSVKANELTINFGQGNIKVQIDDADRDHNAYSLEPGDKVTVNAPLSDQLLTEQTIDASSLFVEKLGTTFYASGQPAAQQWVQVSTPVIPASAVLEGVVEQVSERSFTLKAGGQSVNVQVPTNADNPLDDQGYQKIAPGDRVRVTGRLTRELFTRQMFPARSIISLQKQDPSQPSAQQQRPGAMPESPAPAADPEAEDAQGQL